LTTKTEESALGSSGPHAASISSRAAADEQHQAALS